MANIIFNMRLGLKMYIFLTLEFTLLSKIDMLTTNVNAEYYLQYTLILHRPYHLYIYRTRTQAYGSSFCSSVGRALVSLEIQGRGFHSQLHFSQLVPVGS